MQNRATNTNRKKEIINICLQKFLEEGLFKTSARDLAGILNMQPSGLYYYFKSKDEIVVACAEEVGIRIEDILILPLLEDPNDTKRYMATVEQKLEEAEPMMKFFAQVCTTKEYRESMQPVMERLKERHREYSVKFAESFGCEPEEVAPYLYTCVAVVANYLIFGEELYFDRPHQLIVKAMQDLKDRKKK